MIRHDFLFLCRGFALLAILLLSGCTSVDYYGQLATGQLRLLHAREPVTTIIADPKRDPKLRNQLVQSQQARAFASRQLHLPDNQSYRLYVDIGRPYVVWNVFATDEFSLNAQSQCFPVAGCVAYRGYYNPSDARGKAALQRLAGQDVYLSGVETYSTLGWFDDPIISSMLHWGDERLAALIFHELAHQRFYVKDDSEFNESYANFVEQEGGRQWRVARGLAPEKESDSKQREQFTQLVLGARERLKKLYAQPLPTQVMRERKAAEFERLRSDYRQIRDSQWAGNRRYDPWINAPLNNAKLLPFGLYDQWVPAFAALYKQEHGDWSAFYSAVEKLGGLPIEQRRAQMRKLMGS
ncbi:aminopeptidase [Pseudomonas sp. 10B1]|uniref:aminopeptidase n=1 Tax=unclassified Pseudomonas TaxID=196821 RepID=UPI002AB4A494|nr:MULTISPECIES: aminopeptidase [unclassified Pseudomonas]MDY7562510.1 aminopeptidase [Pseudomonas sp. AB6]MEA9979086.1 aminopeptidase [Pseudomonas sp. RTS4]MEA9995560.1 aminopeptidase [Pseudomonas sp. AA4]MEB0086579.1 aminopeptidase [Pseudomonas sp. RTI1]MEB0127551.1 aminopeptidase [Pseudomonas sp. CCC1.2]